MPTKIVIVLLALAGEANAQININPSTLAKGVQFVGVGANPIAASASGIYYDTTLGKLRIHNADNSYTEIGPGFARAFPATLLSPTGPEVRLESGMDGSNAFLRIDPRDGHGRVWSCTYANVDNAPGADSDAQVGCSWNNPSDSGKYDSTKVSFGWNMEDYCDIATGCVATGPQAEWYEVAGPPFPSGATPWQANHVYTIGMTDTYVTNIGNTYLLIHDGTSAGAGGPNVTTAPGYADITDGTAHWRLLAGFRYKTMNLRMFDGHLTLGLVGDEVCLGNGHSIGDANQICADGSGAHLNGLGGKSAISVPHTNPLTHSPIIFVSDAPSLAGAPSVEIGGDAGQPTSDGCVGLCTRLPITSSAGDGTLSIGDPNFGTRFKDVHVKQGIYMLATGRIGSVDSEGHVSVQPADNAVSPTQIKVVSLNTVTGPSGGYGSRWVSTPTYDVWGEDAARVIGNGTFNIGHKVCTSFDTSNAGNPAAGGSINAIKLTAIVSQAQVGPAQFTAIEIVATQASDAAPENVTEVYRTIPHGGPLGTGFHLGLVAGPANRWCFQPQITVDDGGTYDVKWTATGQSLTY